jgi:hypothetical protein
MDSDPVQSIGDVEGIGETDEMIRYVGDVEAEGHEIDPDPEVLEPRPDDNTRPFVSSHR